MTPHDIAIEFLVPRAFQKYSTCMVHSDFLSPGKNSPLEGGEGGGPNTYCKLEPMVCGDLLISGEKLGQGGGEAKYLYRIRALQLF